MRIGIYVGSFNPVHNSHIDVINYLLDSNYVDKVIVIPTGNYWDKNDLESLTHRINMLKYYETDKIIINETINNLPYTYQVLEKLQGEGELYLIIGADNLEKFYLWKNIEKILQYKILVLPRNNIDMDYYINKYKEKDNFIKIDQFKSTDISSTLIRNKIKDKDYNLESFLKQEVIDYIKDNHLYN